MRDTKNRYQVTYEEIYTDKKYCLCGCGKVLDEENWGLRVTFDGQISSVEDCYRIIEEFENKVKELSKNAKVCNYCGKCCEHAPEISVLEMGYLKKHFPDYVQKYRLIEPCLPCPLSDKLKATCELPESQRPLQCRMLYCEANIVGFETLYNVLADFLGWKRL